MRFLWRPNSKTNSHEGDKNEIASTRNPIDPFEDNARREVDAVWRVQKFRTARRQREDRLVLLG